MKDFTKTQTYKEIVKNKKTCYFISPHLDDAVFSAGGLMHKLFLKNIPITIVNVFTKSSKPPYTLSIKRFLDKCGYNDADELFKLRVKEDSDVAKKINAKVINLGFVDALWRRKKITMINKSFSYLLPEFGFVYPIYRTSIARGHISKDDLVMQSELTCKLHNLVGNKLNSVVFGPAGIGKHTDHLIVRNAISLLDGCFPIYWADYPYFEKDNINLDFKEDKKLKEHIFNSQTSAKEKLVTGYKTQINAIFGKNKIDFEKEFYYI